MARTVWPWPVMVTSHTLRRDPGASRSSESRTSARLEHGGESPELGHLGLGPAPGPPRARSACVRERRRPPLHLLQAAEGRVLPRRAADMFDACGSRPADLVFVPTLACRGVGGPVAGDGTAWTAPPDDTHDGRFAPSPSGTESRCPDGQGLPLSRTMLSNHELPYVGRFACDWLRLATTDPDATHAPERTPRPGLSRCASTVVGLRFRLRIVS